MVTEFVSFASDVALLSEQVQNTVGATDTVAHYLSGGNLFIDICLLWLKHKKKRQKSKGVEMALIQSRLLVFRH